MTFDKYLEHNGWVEHAVVPIRKALQIMWDELHLTIAYKDAQISKLQKELDQSLIEIGELRTAKYNLTTPKLEHKVSYNPSQLELHYLSVISADTDDHLTYEQSIQCAVNSVESFNKITSERG